MEFQSKLKELGLNLSIGHEYSSTDDDYAPSTESLEFLVFRKDQLPESRKISRVSAWSGSTDVYLDDESEFKGDIWHDDNLQDVCRKAFAAVQREKAISLIRPAFEWLEKNNLSYLDGIKNRKTGSFWNGDFVWTEILDLFWQVLPKERYNQYVHKDECVYLYLDIGAYRHPSFLAGFENIRTLKDFSRKELKSVLLVGGKHGVELISHLVFPQKANKVWLILGDTPDKSQKTVWACHPGNPTFSIKHIPEEWEWDGSVLDLWAVAKENNIDFAVKGLNK